MGMSGRERTQWLEQLGRIHSEQKAERDREAAAQIDLLMEGRNETLQRGMQL